MSRQPTRQVEGKDWVLLVVRQLDRRRRRGKMGQRHVAAGLRGVVRGERERHVEHLVWLSLVTDVGRHPTTGVMPAIQCQHTQAVIHHHTYCTADHRQDSHSSGVGVGVGDADIHCSEEERAAGAEGRVVGTFVGTVRRELHRRTMALWPTDSAAQVGVV